MIFIRNFQNISKEDVDVAGGKGASLGEMTKAGIPVPTGFVILSSAFEKSINETDLNVEIDAALDEVNTEEVHTVDKASDKIKALILNTEMPKEIGKEIKEAFKELGARFVAVRSSATAEDSADAAWAGQLETYLNTIKKNLLENVKKCWASLFTPRAIFYRFEKQLHKSKVSVAVVVQKMVESEESGVAFSVHPVTQDKNQLIIEACYGLGEAIVSGQITPNSYVVDKETWKILDKNIDIQTKGLYKGKSGRNERLKLSEKILTSKKLIKLFQDKEVDKIINELKTRYPFILNKIKNHAKKFGWLTYAYIGPVMNEKDVITLIKDSLMQKETICQQISSIKNHYKTLSRKKQEIISKINLPDELKYLLNVSAFFMYLKDLRKGIYQKSYVAMDPVIEEISKRINLTIEQTKYLNSDEINQALLKGKDFTKIAAQRTKYCVAVTENGKTKVFQGEEAKNIIKNQTSKEEVKGEVKELKGLTAYAGKVKGIVKIVCVVKDVPKIKEGEILVSSATNPDLILAMKKAAAFVTDFGGITSHAAIVSREMKKPCIVGTKFATKVLKDGDLVEVDADRGIVKILKKKNN